MRIGGWEKRRDTTLTVRTQLGPLPPPIFFSISEVVKLRTTFATSKNSNLLRSLVLLWARGISCRPSWEFGFALCALPSVSSDGARALRVASWAEGVEFLDRMMYYHSFGFWMGSIHQIS